MINLKYIIIISLLILGCEVKDPLLGEIDQKPLIYMDYNEESSEIFSSLNLNHIEGFQDSFAYAQITWIENNDDLIACIENDSLFSDDFNSTITSLESRCLFGSNQVKGCMDNSAINFDPFAEDEDESCIYDSTMNHFDSTWNQIKFGKFNPETSSFPIYMILTDAVQWFEFEILGLQIDSVEEKKSNLINSYSNNFIRSNYLFFNPLSPGVHEICEIYISKPPIVLEMELNDLGINGDMIAHNQILHSIFTPDEFIPGEYLFKYNNSFLEIELTDTVNLNYNFHPKILGVEMPEEIMLNDSLWTTLEIFVEVFDPNNNINQVTYKINSSKLTNDYYPEFDDDVFKSDPTWTMEYHNWVETSTKRYKTEIPLKPVVNENPVEEGQTGEALFRFNVYDTENERNSSENESKFETSIMLLKCGDEICSDNFGENAISCPEDCGE